MCVYTHTHTHMHVGTSTRMWAQGSGHDIWRSRAIQMDYISGYLYPYMCTKYTCIHMLGGGMRSWTNCFMSFDIIFPRKTRAKHVNVKPWTQKVWERVGGKQANEPKSKAQQSRNLGEQISRKWKSHFPGFAYWVQSPFKLDTWSN